MKRILFSCVLLLGVCAVARAQDPAVRLAFQDGLVTLSANNVLISEVLSEWERVGGTTVKGLDRLPAERVTINLVGVHERTALDAVLGTTGYVSTLGVDIAAGKSLLKSIVVVPRSSSTAAPAVPAREVDMSIPEAQFEFPPATENEAEVIREVYANRPPPPLKPMKVDDLPMPEVRFQFPDPRGSEPPAEPEPEPQPKAEPKPDPKAKKPPSGN